jgi:hypothetical protein
MSYTNTFIQVAPDCPATTGEIPPKRGEKESVAVLHYEFLSRFPYRYTERELYFEVHLRRNGIDPENALRQREKLWKELFARPQACLRASPLPKRYGWGVHYDSEGRIAIYALDSQEYKEFTILKTPTVKLLFAMRGKRQN